MNSPLGTWLVIATLLSTLIEADGQGTFRVGFEGPPVQPPGTQYRVQNYHEAGLWFLPILGTDGFERVGINPPSFYPDNGTAYLQALMGDSLMFGMLDGSAFDLVAVDLAEYSTVVPDAVTVPFVGKRADGSMVARSFTTDGIMDGGGPLADFQTFYFDSSFTGLTEVRIPAYGWSLDNLVLSIPEPGAGGLILLGTLGFLGRFRHRQSPPNRAPTRTNLNSARP